MSDSLSTRRVVMKFGGSSVATLEKLKAVADAVIQRRRQGWQVAVVVSAMGDATDHLLEQAKAVAGEPDRRELDMLLSVGERISMSLLAMAIREAGLEAVSLTGSQSGIITTASHAQARIMEVRPFRVEDELEAGRVVIVAGYQGVSYKREITTLGRGGSDTTAVALAAALSADACEIYSDVAGVFTADPRVVDEARPLASLDYAEMQALAEAGAKVLNAQAVEFAKDRGIALYARKTGSDAVGTVIRANPPSAPGGVRGLAHRSQVLFARAEAVGLDAAERLLEQLEAAELSPREWSHHGDGAQLSFHLSLDDLHAATRTREAIEARLGPGSCREDAGVVTVVGTGVGRDPRLLRRTLSTLRAEGPVLQLGGGDDRIVGVVPTEAVPGTVRALHAALAPGDAASVAGNG